MNLFKVILGRFKLTLLQISDVGHPELPVPYQGRGDIWQPVLHEGVAAGSVPRLWQCEQKCGFVGQEVVRRFCWWFWLQRVKEKNSIDFVITLFFGNSMFCLFVYSWCSESRSNRQFTCDSINKNARDRTAISTWQGWTQALGWTLKPLFMQCFHNKILAVSKCDALLLNDKLWYHKRRTEIQG